MAQIRKAQFWLDNKTGVLTEYTSEINNVGGPKRTVEENENTHINEDDKSFLAGIREGEISINGYFGDVTTALFQILSVGLGSSTTKTFQKKVGTRYWNGECIITSLEGTEDGKKLAMFSANLRVDGAVNATTVALV